MTDVHNDILAFLCFFISTGHFIRVWLAFIVLGLVSSVLSQEIG